MKARGLWRRVVGASIALVCATVLPVSPVLALPEISLTPSAGAVGTGVTVDGTGFESFAGSEVRIFFGGQEITDSPVVVQDNGTFAAQFTVPNEASGTVYVMVSTVIGGEVSQPFTVESPSITLDVETASVDEAVAVSGRGFYSGRVVTIYYYKDTGRTSVAEATTDATGNFTTSFTVPESTAGSHRVRAEDEDGVSVEARLEVTPSLAVKPATGAIGDRLTVSGTGFGGERSVSVYFNDKRVAEETTRQNGSFETNFNVPALESGSADIVAEDNAGHQAATAFAVAARINPVPAAGYVGAQVQVNGVGFRPNVLVSLTYDDEAVGTGLPDDSGSFSAVFVVPASPGGHHELKAADGLNTATAIFTMETVAPPAPGLISPEDSARAEPMASFGWEDVTDDSGLTYTFEVATKTTFTSSSIVIETSGLADPEYGVSEEEKLAPRTKETPYYWRVRAVDGAGNEGDWSVVRSFYVASPFRLSTTATRVLIGIGIGAAAFLGFWFGRRRALQV